MAVTGTSSSTSSAGTPSVLPASTPPISGSNQLPVPPKNAALLAGLTVLTGAVIGLMTSFDAVHWTSAQTTLVATEVAAFWALAAAVTAHLWPQTKKQLVAVAGTVTAFVSATLSVGIGFAWWQLTQSQNASLISLVTVIVAVASAQAARSTVTAGTTPARSTTALPPVAAALGPQRQQEHKGLPKSEGQVRGGTPRSSATGTSGSAGGGRDFGGNGEEGTGGPPGTPGGSGPPHPPGEGPDYGGGGDGPRPRYLRGQCAEIVSVGKPFSLLASIVLTPGPISVRTKPFDVPTGGLDVLLVAYAPELRLLSDQRQRVHVPADTDSEPVMFELRADSPGPRSVSLTAWLGSAYLGELVVEITAERDAPRGPDREIRAEMTTEAAPEGAVSLVVRYDKIQNAYRFEFRDTDYPDEVTSNLTYDPGPLVERLIGGLDSLAKGHSGYDSDQARDYLREQGADLWRELVPERLREQFWARQRRIRQLTILADKDAVPWELLYPLDPGFDAGFLVNQFPVTRAVFGRALPRKLSLRPARFVLPDSLPEAQHEIETMRRLLEPDQPPGMVLSGLTPLKELIRSGDFGLLHFACHNRFDPTDGSSITLDNALFTPTLLTTTAIGRVLARSAPTVFINACRSAGTSATYNRLDGWASKFLEAGAAAFIGSLWAVSDGAAREFAQELYRQLQAGIPLGNAAMHARQLAASHPDDPTWLAYTVYGDPGATVS